ncbi:MAG TPA: DUF2274 domain-containing protein [Rudaea sp.]|jgi:hypothetical protein|nr:DUF2274 domain-containing protein [Rudaea sp.]
MSRSNKPLPSIPVKHVPIRKVVTITKPLETKLRAYIVYYTEQQGLDPKQAPAETDTIVALIENYLARDQGFNRFLRAKSASNSSPKKTAAPLPSSN